MSEFIRGDGRKYDELRPIKIEAGVLERADGSAYLEVGGKLRVCSFELIVMCTYVLSGLRRTSPPLRGIP